MLRLVVDTNVLVSGIIQSGGYPYRIVKLWEDERIILITSPEIIEEVKRVLNYSKIKKRYSLSPETINRVASNLHKYMVSVRDAQEIAAVPNDPDDNKFIVAAVAGKADYIISGDGHLTGLGSYKGIEILTPRAFFEIEIAGSR